jgi:hypothetical protein
MINGKEGIFCPECGNSDPAPWKEAYTNMVVASDGYRAQVQALQNERDALLAKIEVAEKALNKIGILQMGELDYTQDFFEITKQLVREALAKLRERESGEDT